MRWRVAPVDAWPEESVRTVEVSEDLRIAVFRVGGRFYALEDRCSHEDAPLSEGEIVDGCCVKCPWHGARFDLATGRPLSLPAVLPVQTFPVIVENGQVFVEVPETLA